MATAMQRVRRIVPIAALALIVVAFAVGLTRDPSRIPTMLLNVEPPAFDLPPIQGHERGFSSADLKGEVSMVNVFASWCIPCAQEHPNLMAIEEMGGPPIYGIAWKDTDATAAWLARRGDPYAAIGDDADGRVAIDFGVTGAPETFLIDKLGRVRYHHVGVITANDWRQTFEPLIAQLEAE
jgi:cytochrome c biogenesis protein CcmG/thiol:disulfide interchange protein DsbE